jgi:hypothetical protein
MNEYDPKYLLGVIAEQNKVLEQVIAERDDLRQHLENLAPDAPDAHACLRRIYNDPRAKESERGKAAAAAIGYEKAKPTSVSVVIDFKQRVYEGRMKAMERDRARWALEAEGKTIEHQPLDLSAEPAPTILGGGPEDAA